MPDENSNAAALAQHDPLSLANQEILGLRAKLAELQQQNVVAGRFAGEAPRYQLNDPGFYDDTYFQAGAVIEFLDTPNLSMVPLNEPAKRATQAMIERLEDGARRVAARNNREYVGLVTDRNVLIDTSRMDAKAAADAPTPVIQMPQPHGMVPAMPHTEEAQAQERRGRGRPRKATVVGAQAAPVMDRGAPMLAPVPMGDAIVGRMVSQ